MNTRLRPPKREQWRHTYLQPEQKHGKTIASKLSVELRDISAVYDQTEWRRQRDWKRQHPDGEALMTMRHNLVARDIHSQKLRRQGETCVTHDPSPSTATLSKPTPLQNHIFKLNRNLHEVSSRIRERNPFVGHTYLADQEEVLDCLRYHRMPRRINNRRNLQYDPGGEASCFHKPSERTGHGQPNPHKRELQHLSTLQRELARIQFKLDTPVDVHAAKSEGEQTRLTKNTP